VASPFVKALRRKERVGPFAFERWHLAMAAVCVPLCAINMAVAFFGNSIVFPLSPFFLKNKINALGQYALHRPVCLVRGHPDVDEVVRDVEREERLPRGLLGALVEIESAHRPHRISPAGAMGPAQIIPSTARQLDVDDPFDTRDSIRGGARYLATQLRTYRSVPLAVAAYNAGPGAVSGGVIPRNGETESYVTKVLAEYKRRRPAVRPVASAQKSKLSRGVKPASGRAPTR
jgi:soluble lytic murein transglycosylase-like protein